MERAVLLRIAEVADPTNDERRDAVLRAGRKDAGGLHFSHLHLAVKITQLPEFFRIPQQLLATTDGCHLWHQALGNRSGIRGLREDQVLVRTRAIDACGGGLG